MMNEVFYYDNEISNIITNEIEYSNTRILNVNLKNHKFIILYVNVRSLNANHDKLELLVNRLLNKPSVIVCSETWRPHQDGLYQISGYKLYLNESETNKADGVAVYIRHSIIEKTEVIKIDRLSILCIDIRMNNSETIRISATYKSHFVKMPEFVNTIMNYLNYNINIKNHMLVGDFNIDTMHRDLTYEDNISQEFLNNFSEKAYIPCFLGVTRPAKDNVGGTCIDNIFLKSNSMNALAFKLTNPFSDHYPLIVTLIKIAIERQNNKPKNVISYNKLRNNARLMEWSDILSIRNPNSAIDALICKIKDCLNNATVSKTRKKVIET